MNFLKNKVVIITGASQGLGKELSLKMANLGTKIALVSRNQKLLENLRKEIKKNKGIAEIFTCDITSYKQIIKTVEKIISKFKKIDILINCAGIWTTDEFENKNPKLVEKVFMVNSVGHINFTRTVLPQMKKQNKGHILNVISKAGLDSFENKDWPTYTATKWAMTGYTKALKNSLIETKIKVTAFYPGGFESNIFETAGEKEAHNQPWMMKTSQVAYAIIYALDQPEDLSIDSIEMNKISNENN